MPDLRPLHLRNTAPMKYGKRQERAELLVKAFRDLATAEPDGTFKGRSYAKVADEIESQTEFGRELVYFSGLILRALAAGLQKRAGVRAPMKNDLGEALSRLSALRDPARQLCEALEAAHEAAPGIAFRFDGRGMLHAKLNEGIQLPAEVEQRCDYITRILPAGWIEHLKNLDNPLPPPSPSP